METQKQLFAATTVSGMVCLVLLLMTGCATTPYDGPHPCQGYDDCLAVQCSRDDRLVDAPLPGNRWLHLVILIVFCGLPYGEYKRLSGHTRYLRILLITLWIVGLLIFCVYTVMTVMFSYPP